MAIQDLFQTIAEFLLWRLVLLLQCLNLSFDFLKSPPCFLIDLFSYICWVFGSRERIICFFVSAYAIYSVLYYVLTVEIWTCWGYRNLSIVEIIQYSQEDVEILWEAIVELFQGIGASTLTDFSISIMLHTMPPMELFQSATPPLFGLLLSTLLLATGEGVVRAYHRIDWRRVDNRYYQAQKIRYEIEEDVCRRAEALKSNITTFFKISGKFCGDWCQYSCPYLWRFVLDVTPPLFSVLGCLLFALVCLQLFTLVCLLLVLVSNAVRLIKVIFGFIFQKAEYEECEESIKSEQDEESIQSEEVFEKSPPSEPKEDYWPITQKYHPSIKWDIFPCNICGHCPACKVRVTFTTRYSADHPPEPESILKSGAFGGPKLVIPIDREQIEARRRLRIQRKLADVFVPPCNRKPRQTTTNVQPIIPQAAAPVAAVVPQAIAPPAITPVPAVLAPRQNSNDPRDWSVRATERLQQKYQENLPHRQNAEQCLDKAPQSNQAAFGPLCQWFATYAASNGPSIPSATGFVNGYRFVLGNAQFVPINTRISTGSLMYDGMNTPFFANAVPNYSANAIPTDAPSASANPAPATQQAPSLIYNTGVPINPTVPGARSIFDTTAPITPRQNQPFSFGAAIANPAPASQPAPISQPAPTPSLPALTTTQQAPANQQNNAPKKNVLRKITLVVYPKQAKQAPSL